MNAQILTHPSPHLAERIEDTRREVACAEDWATALHDRTRLAEEWNPELASVYGGQDIAVEEAHTAAADLRKELAALEKQAGGTA